MILSLQWFVNLFARIIHCNTGYMQTSMENYLWNLVSCHLVFLQLFLLWISLILQGYLSILMIFKYHFIVRSYFHSFRLRIRPTVLRDVSKLDTTTTILGEKIAFPICVAATAMQRMANPNGEVATSKGEEVLLYSYTIKQPSH